MPHTDEQNKYSEHKNREASKRRQTIKTIIYIIIGALITFGIFEFVNYLIP